MNKQKRDAELYTLIGWIGIIIVSILAYIISGK